MQLWKAGFGYADAPKRWSNRFAGDQKNLGAKQCALDPCIFVYYDSKDALVGIIAVHVDDVRLTGTEDWIESILPKLKQLFEWGEWEGQNFRFTGVNHRGGRGQWSSFDVTSYIAKLKPVDLTRLSQLIQDGQQSVEGRAAS